MLLGTEGHPDKHPGRSRALSTARIRLQARQEVAGHYHLQELAQAVRF